jgi:hypothetical protein
VRGWLVVGVLGVCVVSLDACTDDSTSPDSALCVQVERQGELRAADVTDPVAIAALVAELPEKHRTDAALFYSPFGGDIPDGTDTSGASAGAAGERLYALYRDRCGYEGP